MNGREVCEVVEVDEGEGECECGGGNVGQEKHQVGWTVGGEGMVYLQYCTVVHSLRWGENIYTVLYCSLTDRQDRTLPINPTLLSLDAWEKVPTSTVPYL